MEIAHERLALFGSGVASRGAEPEVRKAGEIVSCGTQGEVRVDAHDAAHARSASSVTASHEVGERALDLRTRLSVVLAPGGIALARPGDGERRLVTTDVDDATRPGALRRLRWPSSTGLFRDAVAAAAPVGSNASTRL